MLYLSIETVLPGEGKEAYQAHENLTRNLQESGSSESSKTPRSFSNVIRTKQFLGESRLFYGVAACKSHRGL